MDMDIEYLVWLPEVEEKIESKNSVTRKEVEEMFSSGCVGRACQGTFQSTTVHRVFGKSAQGRNLTVFIIWSISPLTLVLNARDMDLQENQTPRDKPVPRPRGCLPSFESLSRFWDFWDTHSTVDYEAATIDNKDSEWRICNSQTACPITHDIFEFVAACARLEGVETETLVNLWLEDKLFELMISGSRPGSQH